MNRWRIEKYDNEGNLVWISEPYYKKTNAAQKKKQLEKKDPKYKYIVTPG